MLAPSLLATAGFSCVSMNKPSAPTIMTTSQGKKKVYNLKEGKTITINLK